MNARPTDVERQPVTPRQAAPRRPPLVVNTATALLAIVFFVYVGGNGYRQDLALLFIAYALLALGMYVPLALCGSLSLAYNAYFAIGAYAVALLASQSPLLIWAAIPIAILTSMVIAALLGYVTRRLSGFHLAVATLMFGIATHTWLVHGGETTGGATGIGNIPRLWLFGYEVGRAGLIGAGLAIIWLFATAIGRLRTSIVGIVMRAQREAPVAAEASGVPTEAVRILALAAGAGVASVAGILFALMNQFILPDSFAVSVVFLVLFMPILGGMASPWGSVLGAMIVVAFTLGFDFFQGPGSLTFGVLTLVVLLLAPSGLLGLFGDLLKRVASARAGAPR